MLEMPRRYGDDPRENPCESLALARQTGSVDAYTDRFISHPSAVPSLAKADALGLFLHGLREDIRVRTRSRDVEDISAAMHTARAIKRGLAAALAVQPLRSFYHPYQPSRSNINGRPPASRKYNRSSDVLVLVSHARAVACLGQFHPDPAFVGVIYILSKSVFPSSRQLSQSEYRDLRSKGPCFRCKEP